MPETVIRDVKCACCHQIKTCVNLPAMGALLPTYICAPCLARAVRRERQRWYNALQERRK